MDILLSFPLIVLALVVVAIMGSGIWNVIFAIAIPMMPRAALVVRSSALALRQMLFIEAALTLGSSHWRIIFRHMLPNVMAPYLIMVTAFLGQAILFEASLSFLGLGVAEPTAAWGLMLRGAAVEFAERAPWMALFPGMAISLAVFAFNIFGDSLRDALDPKLRLALAAVRQIFRLVNHFRLRQFRSESVRFMIFDSLDPASRGHKNAIDQLKINSVEAIRL